MTENTLERLELILFMVCVCVFMIITIIIIYFILFISPHRQSEN